MDNEYEKLRQLIIVEKFKNCIVHIDEKNVTAYELAILADEYIVNPRRSKGKSNVGIQTPSR